MKRFAADLRFLDYLVMFMMVAVLILTSYLAFRIAVLIAILQKVITSPEFWIG